MDREMTGLEFAVTAMFGVYMKHQGEDTKLSKDVFLKLIKEELPSFYQEGAEDMIFKGVDLNQDGSVDFQEYAMLIAMYAIRNYEVLQALLKASEKRK